MSQCDVLCVSLQKCINMDQIRRKLKLVVCETVNIHTTDKPTAHTKETKKQLMTFTANLMPGSADILWGFTRILLNYGIK